MSQQNSRNIKGGILWGAICFILLCAPTILTSLFSAGGFPHNLKYALTHLTQLIYIPPLAAAFFGYSIASRSRFLIIFSSCLIVITFFFILFAIRGLFGNIA
jgi:hypothetical protein